MSDEFTNIVSALFRGLESRLERIADDLGSLGQRLASLEDALVPLHGSFAEQSLRLDRIGLRLERIEHRLDLGDAP